MLKKGLKIALFIIFFLLILPYFIPRDFDLAIPEKPYANSVFLRRKMGYVCTLKSLNQRERCLGRSS